MYMDFFRMMMLHLNGWFSDYIFIRGGNFGSTFFNVSDLDLDSRILIEPCAVLGTRSRKSKNNRNPSVQQQSCCTGMRTDRSDLYRSSSHHGY